MASFDDSEFLSKGDEKSFASASNGTKNSWHDVMAFYGT